MHILLTIAHYAQPTREAASALRACLIGWRGLATWGAQDFGGPCIATARHQLDILVLDDGEHTACEYVRDNIASFVHIDGDPLHLPLECRRIMDEVRAPYDLLAYSEHDNWPVTPDFFDRVFAWQNVTPRQVLIPQRFERIDAPPYKVYIDGANGWGDYGAMWCVTAAQWETWRTMPHFLTYTDTFAGALESGGAWSLMQTFECLKLDGIESEHVGRSLRAAVDRSGRRVALTTFVLASLAVYRLSRMLTDEEGPFMVFSKLRGLAPTTSWIGRGLECIMCVSVWVALPVALYIDWSADWWLTWLALAGVTVVIRKWEQKR